MKVTQKPSLHASWIDPFAVDIISRLQRSGFTSYLVGGCVRDLLVGIHPKDFDIATDASPNEVRKKVYGSYIIGKRFRLVLVKRGDQQYEVATFRRESTPEDFEKVEEGAPAPIGDNFFGTPEQDAIRRDFTINALFYDPINNDLIDYAKGIPDIEARILRMIGNPMERIQEDSIRSLRALRLAHKIQFTLEESLRSAIQSTGEVLAKSLMPRRREEYLKFLRLEAPGRALLELYDLGLLKILLPSLNELFESTEKQELFMTYMDRWKELVLNPSDTVELYTAIVWSYSASLGGMKDSETKIDNFMKNELGVFKTEAMSVYNVFQLQKTLRDLEHFRKRGYRRQQAFLRNPELALGLRLATADYTLSGEEISFWQELLSKESERTPSRPQDK